MNNNFKLWASSFSGCDGGNPKSDIWLCGVEWGNRNSTKQEIKNYYNIELPNEINNGEFKLNTSYQFFLDDLDHPFHKAFLKLYSAILNKDISSLTADENEILKLNLSPIAFKKDNDVLWDKNISEVTGFNTKSAFIEYVQSLKRFTTITKEYKPKLILCIGNDSRHNFLNSFFGDENIKLEYKIIRPEKHNKNQVNRYIYHVKRESTLLVVAPFSTSSKGLNSDHLLKKTGEKIRHLINDC